MKRLLILSAAALAVAGSLGCECTRCCNRGATCSPYGGYGSCGTCGTGAPVIGGPVDPYLNATPGAVVQPTPEVYTPTPTPN